MLHPTLEREHPMTEMSPLAEAFVEDLPLKRGPSLSRVG